MARGTVISWSNRPVSVPFYSARLIPPPHRICLAAWCIPIARSLAVMREICQNAIMLKSV